MRFVICLTAALILSVATTFFGFASLFETEVAAIAGFVLGSFLGAIAVGVAIFWEGVALEKRR